MSDFAKNMQKSYKATPMDQYEGSAVSIYFCIQNINTENFNKKLFFQILQNWWRKSGSKMGRGSDRKMAFSIIFRKYLTCPERRSARSKNLIYENKI